MHSAMHRLSAAALFVLPSAAIASDFGPEVHLNGLCWQDECKRSQAKIEKEWRQALKGDYQAQRNIGFCLGERGGCGNTVRVNKIQSCAWRIVLLASGSGQILPVDIDNYRLACEKMIEPIEFATARAQAARLFEEIYRKPIPAGPWSP